MAPYRIIKQGYMLKEPPYSKRGMRKKLKRYWFVLLEDKKQVAFVYYKNEDSYIARQRNVGFIRIDNSRINVIGDYLTHKNAFEIVTEKSEYIFVSETRYELHDWVSVLHNTLESFHRRMERVKVRMEQRQRALSTSSATSDQPSSCASPSPAHQQGATPPTPKKRTTPSKTPPIASPNTGSSSRRRPRRPAPIAPRPLREPPQPPATSSAPNHTHRQFPRQYSHEGPVPMSQVSSFHGYQVRDIEHQIMELEIGQYEEERPPGVEEEGGGRPPGEEEEGGGRPPGEEEEGGGWPYGEEEGEGGWPFGEEGEGDEMPRYVLAPISPSQQQQLIPVKGLRPPPVHQRSVSDTSVLLWRTNSASLPELADIPSSASPEPVSDTVEGARQQISQPESPTKKYRTKHTRHLSLLGDSSGHKRKKRRSQIRSRSPPSYPPPPPPADEGSEEERERDPQRKDSLGFSKVMQTISSIDHELQEMGGVAGTTVTPNISPPMRFRGDDPPNLGSPDEGAAGEGAEVEGERDELGERVNNNSPTREELGGPPTTDQQSSTAEEEEEDPQPLLSPSRKAPPPVAVKPKPKSKPKRNKVMFKEEVEDIPSYEPRIDDETPPTGEGSEEIPSSVAALKQMLFGQAQTQKYSKEGPMSLRFGAFVDTDDYDEGLHELLTPPSQREGTNFPSDPCPDDPHYQHLAGFTHGNGEEGAESVSQPEGNEYDTPWDSKPISKFSVVGHRRSPAQKAEAFEVVSHTTDLPGNMERRNVSSLERQLKSDSRLSPRQDPSSSQPSNRQTLDSDLLQSISTTLQTRSKYGSDSFLTSFSQGDVPANYYQEQGRAAMQQIQSGSRSARADLERIRIKHKRSITLPTAYSGPSQLHQRRSLSGSQQSVSRGMSVGDGRRERVGGSSYHGRPARKTQSVDRLEVDPATLVTYDTYTKSHTLQSLV